MQLLQCIVCKGELEIINERQSTYNAKNETKKVKCLKCGFSNAAEIKGPEVVVIRRVIS